MDTMMKTSSDMASLGQDNAKALMKSVQIWTSGTQAIGEAVATATQAHFEHLMAGWKAMSGVKSLKEAVETQASFMRTSVENAVASTGKITGVTMTLVEESIAPLTSYVTLATEKLTVRPD